MDRVLRIFSYHDLFFFQSDKRYRLFPLSKDGGCYLKLIRQIHTTLCHVCSVHLAHWKRFLYIICVRICICICKEHALYLCMYHDHVHTRAFIGGKKKARDSIYIFYYSVIMSLVKIRNTYRCRDFLEYLTDD